MRDTLRPRLCVLGLDGLPLSLAHTLCDMGLTPNLSRLLQTGNAHAMRAELPELSPVNWTSFFTAAGPEDHGVFGFTRIDPRAYTLSITDATALQAPTLAQRLGEHDLTSKIINLPNTYPAQPLRGMLVAGFVAPELTRAVYPPFLAGPLNQAGYRLEADTVRGKDDPAFLIQDLKTLLDSRRAALDLLWPDLAWDLFVFVLTETDRLFHFQYPALADTAHPLHAGCADFLTHWDQLVGDVLDRYEALPEPKRLLVLADHGFTKLVTEVDINSWLIQRGLLELGAASGENDLSAMAHTSQAFALDPGRIYLHTPERFAKGTVSPQQAQALEQQLVTELMALEHEGRPVLAAVHKRTDLYPGPRLGIAPDLVCEPNAGFSLTAKFDGRDLFGLHGRHGVHTVGDAFFYDSMGARPQRLRDTGHLVLDFFGVPTQD